MDDNVEESDADENDQVLERVAAIDVAKASGKVCVCIPGRGRRITKVFDVKATTNAIMTLADELSDFGIERVALESTSDYWRPFFYLLEARGLCVWLVNARDVKNVPGRPKTLPRSIAGGWRLRLSANRALFECHTTRKLPLGAAG